MAVEANNKKQNPDYTNSAENLCNPTEVKAVMAEYQSKLNDLEAAKAKIPEEIMNLCIEAEAEVQRVHNEVKKAIDQFGSFQDIEAGVYAVKYRRISKVYDVEPFKEHYPKFVPAVVVETINAKALEGVIKGGLIEEADLKMYKVITEDVGYAYFVR